jgi:hypothetical protein
MISCDEPSEKRARKKMASRKLRNKYHEVLDLLWENIGQSKI